MKPLYRFSLSTAKNTDEIAAWRDSLNENIRCRDYLDEQVRTHFDGMNLPDECAENTVKEFGFDRTFWVIANTILQRKGDGRFHRENIDWARNFNIPNSSRNSEFALNSHSCIVDGLAGQVQKMYEKLNLFSVKHIVQSDEPQEYTGKLLIIRDTALKEEFRTPENQLFLAESGFGCSPDKIGRKVFGQFLSDGERTHFYREDFLGEISDEFVPDWARERLSELASEQQNSPEIKM